MHMRKTVVYIIPSFLLFAILLGGYLYIDHLLSLPFRTTNDALHDRNSDFNLDFLIPGGFHIDEGMTIEDVARVRMKKEKVFYEKWTHAILDLIPLEYRYIANLIFFLFWLLCFMTFFRVFTFMGYYRSLRVSLFCGGATYYFMPDFAPGTGEDTLLVGLILSFLTGRGLIVWRKGKKAKKEKEEKEKKEVRKAAERTGRARRDDFWTAHSEEIDDLKSPPKDDSTPKISVLTGC